MPDPQLVARDLTRVPQTDPTSGRSVPQCGAGQSSPWELACFSHRSSWICQGSVIIPARQREHPDWLAVPATARVVGGEGCCRRALVCPPSWWIRQGEGSPGTGGLQRPS